MPLLPNIPLPSIPKPKMPSLDPSQLIPNPVLDPTQMMGEGVKSLFLKLANDFLGFAFELFGKYVTWLTDFSRIPKFESTIDGLQIACGTLLGVIFLKRAFMGLWGLMTDEEDPNWAELIGRTVIAAFLVFATPVFLKDYVVPIANGLTLWITSFGINIDNIGGDIFNKYAPPDVGIKGIGIGMAFVLLLYAASFFGITIAGAIRFVELTLATFMGIVAAVCYLDSGEIYRMYWQEALAITFTQCIHVYLCFLSIQWAVSGEFWKLILAIATLWVAYKGPAILRQYIYTSGAAQGMSSAGRFGMMRMSTMQIIKTIKK